METEEILKFIRKIMSMIDEAGEQEEKISDQMAREHDSLLSNIYNEFEDLQDKIDPSGEIRNQIT